MKTENTVVPRETCLALLKNEHQLFLSRPAASQLEQNASLVKLELKSAAGLCSRPLTAGSCWTKNGGKPQLGECDARTDAQRGAQAQVATCFKQRYRPLVTDHQAGGNVLSMNLVRPKT